MLGMAQLVVWIAVAVAAERFDPGSHFGQRPFLLVTCLLAANCLLYFVSLALVWRTPTSWHVVRRQWRTVFLFVVLFRLALWWSQPIQELDLYRYLWDGRVLAEGVNPYRYSPAQVEAARDGEPATPELATLAGVLRRSPEVTKAFSLIDHRSVPTIYPPLSEAIFAATAFIIPERAPVRLQIGVFKGVLLLFDLATVLLVMGLLRNLNQPPVRALAYAWCPLVLKEFANTGHLDAIAVCLIAAVFWLLTLPRSAVVPAASPGGVSPRERTRGETSREPAGEDADATSWRDWLAAGLWGGAVLAKLYPIVLAPVLLAFWWRRVRWRTGGLFAAFALVVLGGYGLLPPISKAPKADAVVTAEHSNFSGLGEFLCRWEMNDLLFSVMYENVRLRPPEYTDQAPWYSVVPGAAREQLNGVLAKSVSLTGLDVPANRFAFLFTQALAAGTLFVLADALALRRWSDDPREALLRRSFLCLAWLWFLSATQNPWYWTWTLPLVVFVSRPWLLVSGFAMIYYLRFWFVYQFHNATLLGGLTGMRFFDVVVVWFEHLPPLCAVALVACLCRKWVRANRTPVGVLLSSAHLQNVVVVIPALNEEASLPQVITRLRQVGLNCIRVVDNGSQDRTAAVAQRCGAEVIREPRRGYGQACWTGCQNLPAEVEWILFCNADGSDDLEGIPQLLAATEGGAEFVLGARTANVDGKDYLTAVQRFGDKLAVTLMWLLWGARYADLGPLRLISRRAFERLKMQDRGFGWTVEMQVRAVEVGVRTAQVQVRNFPRHAGVSKISGTFKGSVQAGTIILATIGVLWLKRRQIQRTSAQGISHKT